jgi:DnaK suppressor protein
MFDPSGVISSYQDSSVRIRLDHEDGCPGWGEFNLCAASTADACLAEHHERMDVSIAARSLAVAREETLLRIASMTADLEAMTLASVDSNIDDEHDPEGSTVAFERAQLLGMLMRTQSHLTDVGAALERVSRLEYGRCAQCDNPIADARLAALPAARTCIACATR